MQNTLLDSKRSLKGRRGVRVTCILNQTALHNEDGYFRYFPIKAKKKKKKKKKLCFSWWHCTKKPDSDPGFCPSLLIRRRECVRERERERGMQACVVQERGKKKTKKQKRYYRLDVSATPLLFLSLRCLSRCSSYDEKRNNLQSLVFLFSFLFFSFFFFVCFMYHSLALGHVWNFRTELSLLTD